MGQEIKQGLDSTIDDAANITGSATGWASRMIEVVEALKSSNNELGSAAKKAAVQTATAGAVPELDSNGKINLDQLQTSTTGGQGAQGLIPLLNSSGLIPSAMISGSGTGSGVSGIRGIWFYSNVNQYGTGGTWYQDTRRWLYEWLPRGRNNVYTGATSVLFIVTGGGGAGAHGPAAHTDRKGGGGGAGSTVIGIRTGLTSASVLNIWVGHGGDEMVSGSVGTNNDGAASGIGTSGTNLDIATAGGGSRGNATGNGGQSNTGGVGNQERAIYLRGGSGHDGLFDRLGAGAGGASFWGGGFSGGNGRGGGRNVAYGAGGGAASGSLGVSPYTFTANANGKAGAHGCVLILGF